MDLIYTDKNKIDVGVMKDYSFDLAFGEDENNFQLSITSDNNVCEEDGLVYIEGTEYGGIIDAVEVYTAEKTINYKGRTWHGILNTKIIQPDSGAAYYTVSGDANTIMGTLITRLGLNGLFSASSASSGFTISSYSFKRYTGGYDGIVDMLQTVGAKLHIEWSNGVVQLSAVAAVDYGEDDLSSDHIALHIQKTYNPVNHLICLGQGELAQRTVVHLYCDANGNISATQTFTGMEEVADVFDFPNAESAEELQKEGKKKLKELNNSDEIEVSLDDAYEFDVGDKITADDAITGITVSSRVLKKIVTIDRNQFLINYKVGE
jgi:hypothetical protein